MTREYELPSVESLINHQEREPWTTVIDGLHHTSSHPLPIPPPSVLDPMPLVVS